ncbi:MAG: hypothetical protein EBU84_07540 [Actinobacteria bacterium]|nr:hypothetical protein [Actinomycetota bacterium]
MAEAVLQATFTPETTETATASKPQTWTRTKGLTHMTMPVFFSPSEEAGRDIVPLLPKGVRELYLQYRDAEGNAKAAMEAAKSPEEKAFYRGQVALMAVIRDNFQKAQKSNRGLLLWRIAPENADRVAEIDANLEEAINRNNG